MLPASESEIQNSKLNNVASVFQSGLNNGGPSGLLYGFLFTWLGSIFQILVMGEMASMLVTHRDIPSTY